MNYYTASLWLVIGYEAPESHCRSRTYNIELWQQLNVIKSYRTIILINSEQRITFPR
jgi:hypothetical protein